MNTILMAARSLRNAVKFSSQFQGIGVGKDDRGEQQLFLYLREDTRDFEHLNLNFGWDGWPVTVRITGDISLCEVYN